MATYDTTSLVLCLTGPESSGKSTLARQLADALSAPLVPEVARGYLEGRVTYEREDLLAIAELQVAAEHQALAKGERVVVADTDLVVISIWWQEKFGELHPFIARALEQRSRRCYLLTLPDLPWQPDPLRESEHDRERLLSEHRSILESASFPYASVGGQGEVRLLTALDEARRWLFED